jgi:hypothetical protein
MMSNGGGGAPVTGGVGGGVLQCRRRRERVRRTPIESHDAQRTGSPRRRKIDVGGGSDFWWGGGEATGGRRGQARWGAGRQWRIERMEKKTERKGSEVGDRRLLKALGCVGGEGKRRGGQLGAAWGQEKERRGGPMQWSAVAPGRQAWAAVLLRDRGGWRGAGDAGAGG